MAITRSPLTMTELYARFSAVAAAGRWWKVVTNGTRLRRAARQASQAGIRERACTRSTRLRQMRSTSRSKLPRQVRGFLERSAEHTSELPSLMRSSYAAFCLQKNKETDHQLISGKHK